MSEEKTVKRTSALSQLPIVKKLKGIKNIEMIVSVVLIALILLIYFSSFTSDTLTTNTSAIEYTTSVSYINQLESKLDKTLSEIEDAGQVCVMVTLESGPEIVIATSTDQKTSIIENGEDKTETITIVEDPIIVTQNGTSSPIILMEILPKVKGVIVVAEGADDIGVKLDLLNAIKALLTVPNDNIQIFAMK